MRGVSNDRVKLRSGWRMLSIGGSRDCCLCPAGQSVARWEIWEDEKPVGLLCDDHAIEWGHEIIKG